MKENLIFKLLLMLKTKAYRFSLIILNLLFMWRHILLGAARLLQPGGMLVVKDQAPDGFSNSSTVERFASQVGLSLELHVSPQDCQRGA